MEELIRRFNKSGVRSMCLDDLIRAKEAAGRPQDLSDAAFLREKEAAMKSSRT